MAYDVNESNIGDQIVTLQNLKEEGKDAHWNMVSIERLYYSTVWQEFFLGDELDVCK